MVFLLDPAKCHHATCHGGRKARKGAFGGTHCPCRCHTDPKWKAEHINDLPGDLGKVLEELENK